MAQIVITIGEKELDFVKNIQSQFSGFAVTKPVEGSKATQSEVMQALVEFAKLNRIKSEWRPLYDESGELPLLDDDGEQLGEEIEIDGFALAMQDVLALREDGGSKRNSKVASLQSKLDANEAKLAELMAKLAKMEESQG